MPPGADFIAIHIPAWIRNTVFANPDVLRIPLAASNLARLFLGEGGPEGVQACQRDLMRLAQTGEPQLEQALSAFVDYFKQKPSLQEVRALLSSLEGLPATFANGLNPFNATKLRMAEETLPSIIQQLKGRGFVVVAHEAESLFAKIRAEYANYMARAGSTVSQVAQTARGMWGQAAEVVRRGREAVPAAPAAAAGAGGLMAAGGTEVAAASAGAVAGAVGAGVAVGLGAGCAINLAVGQPCLGDWGPALSQDEFERQHATEWAAQIPEGEAVVVNGDE